MLQSLAVLTAACCVAASLPAASQDRARLVECRLVVNGREYIGGQCRFEPIGRDGSFQIMSLNGKYFAQVNVERPGIGLGYWNEDPQATHAHSDLGELTRRDGCWSNGRAAVCAW